MPITGLTGTPLTLTSIIHLAPGEKDKQETIYQVPANQLVVIESVGINSFLQLGQELFAAIIPFFDHGACVFPIALLGSSFVSEPALPFRRFGSQQILSYADNRIDISAIRYANEGKAQIEFNISGRLLS